jgi:hypothetical protein
MLAQRFNDVFLGLTRAHGTYVINGERADGKKQGKAQTIREDVTLNMWSDHLEGKRSLGIIPINDNSECYFGAIDVDTYDGLDFTEINKKLEEYKLPLFPCQSKSGGVHLYLFTKEAVPAGLMQAKLRDIAAALGFGGCEIFPKQTHILAERGDIGQWINMPYFGKTRWCNGMPPTAFIERAEQTRLTKAALEKLETPKVQGDFDDGPPCLQHLAGQGFPQGTRNNGLFNVAVYCRKRNPDDWQKDMEEFNVRLMDPPLPSTEVQGVIKSASRKDYQYTCSKAPVAPYCNPAVCKLRKFGVGTSNDMPAVHSLTKYNTTPPLWFLDVDGGGRLELDTDDLQNQRRFQRKCMERLNVMPTKMSDPAWTKLINHLLENLTVIEAPVDASPVGQLFEHVERFCTGRVKAKNRDELLLGKPWTEDGRHFFRVADLMAYLDRMHFRDYKVHQVTAILKANEAEHHFFNCKGKGVNAWSVPEFQQHEGDFETPSEVEQDDDMPF